MKTLFKWIGNLMTVVLIVIIIIFAANTFQAVRHPNIIPSIFGYKSFKVLSGSMEPFIKTGNMIIVKSIKSENIKVGDIITFKVSDKVLVTHRVKEIVKQASKSFFKTKGDANNVADVKLVSPNQVVGSYAYQIPGMGLIMSFAKSKRGFVVFILFPALLLLGMQIKKLMGELRKDKRQQRTNIKNNKVEV